MPYFPSNLWLMSCSDIHQPWQGITPDTTPSAPNHSSKQLAIFTSVSPMVVTTLNLQIPSGQTEWGIMFTHIKWSYPLRPTHIRVITHEVWGVHHQQFTELSVTTFPSTQPLSSHPKCESQIQSSPPYEISAASTTSYQPSHQPARNKLTNKTQTNVPRNAWFRCTIADAGTQEVLMEMCQYKHVCSKCQATASGKDCTSATSEYTWC